MPGQVESSSNDDALQRLAALAARRRVVDKSLDREIYYAAHDVGLSQRQISEVVGGVSQSTVQRTLRRITADPSLLEETPGEVIDQRAAGMIGDQEMMDNLLDRTYSFGRVPSIDGVATDAYIPGDWDEVETAYYRDLLSDEEFDQLMERHGDEIEQAAHLDDTFRMEQAAYADETSQIEQAMEGE